MSALRTDPTPRWKTLTRAGIALGLLLACAGFVLRDISARAFVERDIVSTGLWLGGALLIGLGVILNFRALLGALRSTRTAEQINFAVVLVLALAIAGLLCYISTRRFWRMDWTGAGQHRLHSQTVNILKNLDRDVLAATIYSSGQPGDFYIKGRIADLLEELKSRTPHIETMYLDLDSPGTQQRLRKLLQERLHIDNVPCPSVVFATEARHETVLFENLVESSRGPQGSLNVFKGESAFAGALVKLTEEKRATLYALTGHGEKSFEPAPPASRPGQARGIAGDPARSMSRALKALKNAYYEVKPLDLAAVGKVPDDCDALVLAGPHAPLSEGEMKAIRAYLDERKGAALFLLDSRITPHVKTNMAELLSAYGIEPHEEAVGVSLQLVLDAVGVRQSPQPMVLVDPQQMANHPATKDLEAQHILLQDPCPLRVRPETAPENLRPLALLKGRTESWGESDLDAARKNKATYEPDKDMEGPVVVGAVVEPRPSLSQSPGAETPSGPRIVALGGSESFLNYSVESVPGNLYLLLNCVNWAAGKVQMLGIPPKTMEINVVSVSGGALRASRYIFMGGIPGLIVVLGVVVWLIRRR
ncbi:MAG: GldG family protein [Planctomycetes bacterium]|nr:GldG family protein [Planctomycetota bacterium]